MIIKYIGHACFKIRDNETGYSIVFDPYTPDSVRGFGKIVDTASEVLCSHGHFDHNYTDAVMIEPKDESPYEVQFIESWHDDQGGALRGPNRITVVTDKKTGEKLIHYGDIGVTADQLLAAEGSDLVMGADIALIPVGGTYTIDADQAIDLIKKTSPKIAIPMHYKFDSAPIGLENIGSIEDFLNKAHTAGLRIYSSSLFFHDTADSDLEDCVLAIRPQNM